ncbi:MAG: hypothetical protein ACRD2R_03535 [Terriglobales bacterium]
MSGESVIPLTAQQKRRLRGEILQLVGEGHDSQRARLDDTTLWGALRRLGHDVGRLHVLTLLQELEGRGYLSFKETKDEYTSRVRISEIELMARGRDLLEETFTDQAVQLK